ncbi:MAG: site-specific integrase [Gammaproteobacteria bacterium]|nr:site-specific integrase [Gammaproteobacteria bacterium]
MKKLDTHLRGVLLTDINRGLIEKITTARCQEKVKPATVNRMLEVLRAILRRAENHWEWLDKAPHVRMLPEPKIRIRYLTTVEFSRLIAELPNHLAYMASFSICTGLRENNVTQLNWSQIDMSRSVAWIHSDQSKTGKAITVPLSLEAKALLKDLEGNHSHFVFTYQKWNAKIKRFENVPVSRANNHAWRKALVRAGIENFRWHDLRHTWASWHIQNGTPLHVLQELGGWSSTEMVKRYAHLSPGHLSEYAGNANRKII